MKTKFITTWFWQIKSVLLTKKGNKQAQAVMAGVQSRSGIGALLAFVSRIIVLTFFGAIVVFPFFWMISVSFKTYQESLDPTIIVPAVSQTSNYDEIFGKGFGDAFGNSLLITVLSTLSTLVIIIPSAYAFGRINFMGKKIIWGLFLSILAMPEVALLLGQYRLIVQLGLNKGPNTIVALFLPFISSVASMYLLRNAFESVPQSHIEAAMIDGASQLQIFVKIILPSVKGAIYISMIFTIIAAWNSYTWPALILSSGTNEYRTLPVWLFSTGIKDMQGNTYIESNVRMAASFIVILPLLGFYLLLRKRILNAVGSRGGIKG